MRRTEFGPVVRLLNSVPKCLHKRRWRTPYHHEITVCKQFNRVHKSTGTDAEKNEKNPTSDWRTVQRLTTVALQLQNGPFCRSHYVHSGILSSVMPFWKSWPVGSSRVHVGLLENEVDRIHTENSFITSTRNSNVLVKIFEKRLKNTTSLSAIRKKLSRQVSDFRDNGI